MKILNWFKYAIPFLGFLIGVFIVRQGSFLELKQAGKGLEEQFAYQLKSLQLLSRTSVLENGLRFGARHMVETVLNRAVLGESALEVLVVLDRFGQVFAHNTLASDGLYTPTPDWIGDSLEKQPQDWKAFPQNTPSYFQISVPIEYEDEYVGSVSGFVNIKKQVQSPYFIAQQDPSSFQIQTPIRIKEFYLQLAYYGWVPQAFLVGLLCAILSGLFFWIGHLWKGVQLKKEFLYRQALKVAHDIRSPIAALWSLQKQNSSLNPTDKRLLQNTIQRIHSIAEDLLAPYRLNNAHFKHCLLADSVVRAIRECELAEKFKRENLKIAIQPGPLDLVVALTPAQVERVLSILLSNAVEAADEKFPQIKVEWKRIEDEVRLKIVHNGRVKKTKPFRHGLGRLYIQELLGKNWTEPISAFSSGEVQTYIHLDLPLNQRPSVHFVEKIRIQSDQSVVLIEDDVQFGQSFQDKLKKLNISSQCFRNKKELEAFGNFFKSSSCHWFVDFYLGFGEVTGPEILSELDPNGSILFMTNSLDEPGVIEAAQKWNAKILPKSILDFVPFEIEKNLPDLYALVDDDELTQTVWQCAARAYQVQLVSFKSIQEFESGGQGLNRKAEIYLDGGLIQDSPFIVGKMQKQGFKNLHITTGTPLSLILKNPGIQDIRDKTPPWVVETR